LFAGALSINPLHIGSFVGLRKEEDDEFKEDGGDPLRKEEGEGDKVKIEDGDGEDIGNEELGVEGVLSGEENEDERGEGVGMLSIAIPGTMDGTVISNGSSSCAGS